MPRLDKAIRREKKRRKQQKMKVDGRGLITDTPNEDRRKKKRTKRVPSPKYDTLETYDPPSRFQTKWPNE